MIDWYVLLVPLAVLGVFLLFRLVGCSFDPSQAVSQPYADDVTQDNPIVYYRLQEEPGATTAADETGHIPAQYGIAPSQQLGQASVMQSDSTELSVRFNGSFVSTQGQGSLGDLSQFSADVLVHPEWDIANERNFYCVMDYSIFVPGLPTPGPQRNAGFAIYAGPDVPTDPTSPICWQLWIGTGDEFARANPIDGSPGPLVSAEDTYLAVQFGDTTAFLWAFTAGSDVDQVKFPVIRRPYVQATSSDPANLAFNAGISQNFAALIPPFPGPSGFIYPFVGRIAEVAVYNTMLDGGRIMSHIMNAFNITS
jgi:hypothetical protein